MQTLAPGFGVVMFDDTTFTDYTLISTRLILHDLFPSLKSLQFIFDAFNILNDIFPGYTISGRQILAGIQLEF